MSGPTPTAVMDHLREHGVTVHHARQKRDDLVVVYLEGYCGQHEIAIEVVTAMPGVTTAALAPDSTAILLVRTST